MESTSPGRTFAESARESDLVKGLAFSYVAGVVLGGSGRLIGGDFRYAVPAVLPGIDLIGGSISPGHIPAYFAYGLGVATAYADRVLPEILNFLQ